MRKLIYIKERRYTMKPLKLDRLFEELEDTGPDRERGRRAADARSMRAGIKSGDHPKANTRLKQSGMKARRDASQAKTTGSDAIGRRAVRFKPTPSKRAQRDSARTDAWNNYQGDSDNR